MKQLPEKLEKYDKNGLEWYIVKCEKHFPGYELFVAVSEEDAIRQMKMWSCYLDFSTLEVDDQPEIGNRGYELRVRFEKDFKEKNPEKYKRFMALL